MKRLIHLSCIVLLSGCSEENKAPNRQKNVLEKEPIGKLIHEKTVEKVPKEMRATKISSLEDSLINLIWNLKEVQDLNQEIDLKSNGKRNLATFIASEPSDDTEYYGISVSEDNGDTYATYFQFHIYPNKEIRYYDPIEDQEMSLTDWRKQKK